MKQIIHKLLGLTAPAAFVYAVYKVIYFYRNEYDEKEFLFHIWFSVIIMITFFLNLLGQFLSDMLELEKEKKELYIKILQKSTPDFDPEILQKREERDEKTQKNL